MFTATKLKGRIFNKKVSQELLENHLKRRLQNHHLDKRIRAGIARMLLKATMTAIRQQL